MAFLSFLKKKGEECVYVPSMGTGRQQELELKQNIVDVFRLEFPPQARRDCRAAKPRACVVCNLQLCLTPASLLLGRVADDARVIAM